MWLLHCIPVFLSISHFSLSVNANLPEKQIWVPFVVGDDFIRQASRYQPKEHLPTRVSRTICGLNCFSSPSTSVSEPRGPGEKMLSYFKTHYSRLPSRWEKKVFLRQSISYLVGAKSISPELLKLWTDELGKTLNDESIDQEEIATVLYGLHTLILKNHGQDDHTNVIQSSLNECMANLRNWDRSQFPDGLPLWNQEIITPQDGLSDQLRKYDFLATKLLGEPRLHQLSAAIAHQVVDYVWAHLTDIRQIFSVERELRELSSYTRVAAIALLFHAMHLHEVSSMAQKLAQSIIEDAERQEGVFLLEHEKALLKKVLNDEEVLPIEEQEQETAVSPR